MDKRTKIVLLSLAAALAVGAAAYNSVKYFKGGGRPEPKWSPQLEGLSDEEREKKLDDAERTRRKMGRGSSGRRLPEDKKDPTPGKPAKKRKK